MNEGGQGEGDTAAAVMLPALLSIQIRVSLAETLYRRESAVALEVPQSPAETVSYKLSTSTLCFSFSFSFSFSSFLCAFLSFSLSLSFSMLSLFFSSFLWV